MFEFVSEHQFWAAVVIYWIFSAAVSSMPDPETVRSPGYLWLYRFLHSIAGNVTTAFAGSVETRLVRIIRTGVQAYQQHTGEPLDPALIKAEEPL